jgi:catechol 2,3-dioxygenase-like lactoylglutathione lyase family enzyme/GNAT superfamily N-acetyltransferase
MIFKHHVPILYSTDITRSIAYYKDVLGFEHSWEWDNPPTFGGISKDGVEIFFCKDGQGHPGTWLSIFIEDADAYYETIKAKGARIIQPPHTYEWGVREMLVEDPDGHKIRFGHGAGSRPVSESLPVGVTMHKRNPTVEEYIRLSESVWGPSANPPSMIEKIVAAPLFAVVAEHEGKAVGCALLLGDGASFYYVKDVMVQREWQCKRIGTAMMSTLNDWLQENGINEALVALITGEGLIKFYKEFGFRPAFAMQKRVHR